MTALPYLLSSLFGWAVAHFFSLLDRHSNWLRLLNYPVGIAGAAAGTMASQSTPTLHNKLFVLGILSAGIALLLFQSLRRLIGSRREVAAGVDRVL